MCITRNTKYTVAIRPVIERELVESRSLLSSVVVHAHDHGQSHEDVEDVHVERDLSGKIKISTYIK